MRRVVVLLLLSGVMVAAYVAVAGLLPTGSVVTPTPRPVAPTPPVAPAGDPPPVPQFSLPRDPVEGASEGRPNIVLLILDTLRADRVGHLNPKLPAGVSDSLDAFAAQGVVFERTIAQASWTRPSVGSMSTSRYPRELGLYREKWDRLPDSATTLAEALSAAGYRTVGLTANPNLNRAFNFDQGFEIYIDSNVVFPWMDSAPTNEVQTAHTRWRTARELFQLAMQLGQSPHEGPTFVRIDVMEMHEAAADVMFRPGTLAYYAQHPDHRYLAMLRQLSEDVGAFMRELSTRPGWEDTLFVVTSDHGEGLTSHPGVADSTHHGPVLYESQCWVPLFLYHRGDRLPRGRVVKRPVRLLDVMPTLLALADVKAPAGLRGRSLLPLFHGDGDTATSAGLPEYFVVETYWRDYEKLGVYSANFKYIDNRKPHAGTLPRELQPNGILENGVYTDVGQRRGNVVAAHAQFLAQWEKRHAKAPAYNPYEDAPPAEAAQLKALGYAQ